MKKKLVGFLTLVITLVMCFTGCTDEQKAAYVNNTIAPTQTVNASAIYINPRSYYIFAEDLAYVQNRELSTEERKILVKEANYLESKYSSINKIRDETALYNCHSYAWYSTAANNNRWIPNPKAMWEGYGGKIGSYSIQLSTTDLYQIKVTTPGTIVGYFQDGEIQHSAVVKNSTTMISKWGAMGLYEHPLHDCPYFGQLDGSTDCDTIKYFKKKNV